MAAVNTEVGSVEGEPGGSHGDAATAQKNTMKAIVYHQYGSPDVLELRDVSKPGIKNGEVLVRVRAAAVNPGDWLYLRGEPYIIRIAAGLFTPRNGVLGRAVAGQVQAAGSNVTRFRPGDEVFAEISKGGFAEYASVAADALALKPASLTYEQAAAVPLVGVTALKGLRDHGKIKPGQKVLINGASGGVGTTRKRTSPKVGRGTISSSTMWVTIRC
jgi:NADPH:quinone reductase-like Zn-dependent oxidoreductase